MREVSSGLVGLALAAILSAGCASVPMAQVTERTGLALPSTLEPLRFLAAGTQEPTYVDLPNADRWPRSMQGGGPMHVAVMFAPYVGVFGALADIERSDAGSGFGVAVGYRMPSSSSRTLDLSLAYEESSHHNPTSDVEGRATRLGARLGMSFAMGNKTRPYAAVGAEMSSLTFDGLASEYGFSGPGLFVGGGIDYSPSGSVSLRAEIGLHVWDATDGSGGGGVTETLSVGLGAAFGF